MLKNELTPTGDTEKLLVEQKIGDLLNKFELSRRIFCCGKVETYGIVLPNDSSKKDIEGSTFNTIEEIQTQIWALAKQQPQNLDIIIKDLVDRGICYQRVEKPLKTRAQIWSDIQSPSEIISETILGIGQTALPFLETHDENFAKSLVKTLRQRRITQKIRTTFQQISTTLKNIK